MVDYNIEVAKKGKAPGLGNQATGAFCFFELSIATQGYAYMIVRKVACQLPDPKPQKVK